MNRIKVLFTKEVNNKIDGYISKIENITELEKSDEDHLVKIIFHEAIQYSIWNEWLNNTYFEIL